MGGRLMKKQSFVFQKLLCFRYKYKLLILDIFCIILAIVSSCIFYQYKAAAPRNELVEICENSLYEYIDNPDSYTPPNHVIISLENNTITAAIPNAFIEITAYRSIDNTYDFSKEVRFAAFFAFSIYCLILYSTLCYFIFEVLLYLLLISCKKLHAFCKIFAQTFRIKFSKFKYAIVRKWHSKTYKEYEDPRLKEIYQLGYNMGHADGLAEATQNNPIDLNCNFT